MSTTQRTEYACDEPGCVQTIELEGNLGNTKQVIRNHGWAHIRTTDEDLCPEHARMHGVTPRKRTLHASVKGTS